MFAKNQKIPLPRRRARDHIAQPIMLNQDRPFLPLIHLLQQRRINTNQIRVVHYLQPAPNLEQTRKLEVLQPDITLDFQRPVDDLARRVEPAILEGSIRFARADPLCVDEEDEGSFFQEGTRSKEEEQGPQRPPFPQHGFVETEGGKLLRHRDQDRPMLSGAKQEI